MTPVGRLLFKGAKRLPRSISGLIDYSLGRQLPIGVNITKLYDRHLTRGGRASPARRERVYNCGHSLTLDRVCPWASRTIRRLPDGDAIPPGSGSLGALPCLRGRVGRSRVSGSSRQSACGTKHDREECSERYSFASTPLGVFG